MGEFFTPHDREPGKPTLESTFDQLLDEYGRAEHYNPEEIARMKAIKQELSERLSLHQELSEAQTETIQRLVTAEDAPKEAEEVVSRIVKYLEQ